MPKLLMALDISRNTALTSQPSPSDQQILGVTDNTFKKKKNNKKFK